VLSPQTNSLLPSARKDKDVTNRDEHRAGVLPFFFPPPPIYSFKLAEKVNPTGHGSEMVLFSRFFSPLSCAAARAWP